jgi:hypothetical protein
MSQFDVLLDIKPDKKTPPKLKPKVAEKAVVIPQPMKQTLPSKQTAKSKHTDYVQTSVYIKKRTQTAVKKILLDDIQNRDFSELVEELLSAWAQKN